MSARFSAPPMPIDDVTDSSTYVTSLVQLRHLIRSSRYEKWPDRSDSCSRCQPRAGAPERRCRVTAPDRGSTRHTGARGTLHASPRPIGARGTLHASPWPTGARGTLHAFPRPTGAQGTLHAFPRPTGAQGTLHSPHLPRPTAAREGLPASPRPTGARGGLHTSPRPTGARETLHAFPLPTGARGTLHTSPRPTGARRDRRQMMCHRRILLRPWLLIVSAAHAKVSKTGRHGRAAGTNGEFLCSCKLIPASIRYQQPFVYWGRFQERCVYVASQGGFRPVWWQRCF